MLSDVPAFRSCGTCPIRHRAVCSLCDEDEFKLLESIKYYRTYQAGQPIIWRGDHMNFVASVVSGVAALDQTMEDGRTQMVGLLLPSDFVGRPGRDNAPYDVKAITDVTLCCFRLKLFEQLVRDTPHIGARMLDMALDELDVAREWMLVLGRKTAREKIASLLVLLAKRNASLAKTKLEGPISISLPLTREAMANYLGLTLETVSRQFSKLKADKVISLNGKSVGIADLDALVAESGDESIGTWPD